MHVGDADRDRRAVGVDGHLRSAGRRPGAVCDEYGRARPEPSRRSASKHRDRRAEHRSGPVGERTDDAGRLCRTAVRRRTRRSQGRLSGSGSRGEVLRRLHRLHDVGAAGSAGALGRRLRPDGIGDGRGIRRGATRPGSTVCRGGDRHSQRRPRRGAVRDGQVRSAAYPTRRSRRARAPTATGST